MTTEITNKNGKDYAVIPYELYQQLIEDAETLSDIKAYDLIKNKSEESFPAYVVDRIYLQQQNPIKVYREYRNLSQSELAKKVNITLEYLQQIENDINVASQQNLEVIAQVLNIDLDIIT
jgi:DNA-binding XRE family transcriptional regulator